MNLDHLRYFACLAQVKHYTRAAQQLCISQPSLSHAIRQLEGELGVPLFEKTGRNTTLTPFGETFLWRGENPSKIGKKAAAGMRQLFVGREKTS